MHLHFTDIAVQRLKELGEHYDTTTPAFGIRVGKNRKTWFVIRGKKRLRTTIGRYPAIPLIDARKAARTLLNEAPTNQSRVKFEDAYEGYKETIKRLKPRTQADYKRLLEKYYLPTFRVKKLPDITYEQIMEAVCDTAKYEKAHALAVGRTFFKWCVRPPRRYIPHSPLEGVEVVNGRKRKRTLTGDEIPIVWNAAEEQGYPHGTLVQLLILLGQRRGETAHLRWPWINEKERLITFPEWVTKNKREHIVPYGQMTADILETVPRLNSTDLLFPSRVSGERPMSGWSKFKRELDENIEISRYTLHDLRRTFRSALPKLGVPRETAERLLNHVSGANLSELDEIYNRYEFIDEKRDAVTKWQSHVQQLLAA